MLSSAGEFSHPKKFHGRIPTIDLRLALRRNSHRFSQHRWKTGGSVCRRSVRLPSQVTGEFLNHVHSPGLWPGVGNFMLHLFNFRPASKLQEGMAWFVHLKIIQLRMKTFADKVIGFNKSVDFHGSLPAGIRMMNPFRENESIIPLSSSFYKKYYNDNRSRHLILGINPGRFGGGITGIPFTDPKRLVAKCHIPYGGKETHEPSSVFVYDVIEAYGGVEAFYNVFYINSVCPLGFTSSGSNGREINYNNS